MHPELESKIIEGFPNYRIYENGDVFNIKKGKRKKAFVTNNGYIRIGLSEKGKVKTILLHRLVAIAFIPNPDNLPEVNHIDGNKLNCAKSNLEWNTSSENQKHAFKLGLQKPTAGEKNPMAKLNNTQIMEIRKLSSEGYTRTYLKDKYNVDRTTIARIINNKTWNTCTLK